jgi:uncharacterized repeat protein (TIGR03803 family)
VVKTTPSGAVTVLHTFDGTDGSAVIGGLTLGLDGNFYGAAAAGGGNGYGTVFKVTPEGNLTTLYSFTNGKDGGAPLSPPILGRDGNFYGTTYGANGNNGSVYEITPSGVFSIVHSFDGVHGANPEGPLVQATDGSFYGTTNAGGANGLGTIFKITPIAHVFTVLYNFDGTHGANPVVGLIQADDGNLYGITPAGGSVHGILFKITLGGVLTVLHDFTGGSDGENPIGGLTQATDGNIYGTDDIGPLAFAGGVIFSFSPCSGKFTVLHQFDFTHGGSAQTTLLQHTNGVLYSDTAVGGSADRGVFYSFDVGLSPFVTFLPASLPVGGVAQILGQGFTDATAVSFNGTPAAFTVESDTYMTAKVPAGATTGHITVTEPSGTLKSNVVFRVLPQIFSFSPTSGPVGTKVVITGESFTGATIVELACKFRMSFTVDSDTQITAIVPPDATTGELMVFTPGGHVETTAKFTVTP